MEYVLLNNGVKMPLLGFGTWNLKGKECIDCVLTAIETGYRLIDTAQMYDNEREVGEAVSRCGTPRQQLFLTTKICFPQNSYASAKTAIAQSLEALRTEYIDLLLIHEPYREASDMYAAMFEAYQKGLVRALGVSNFNAAAFAGFCRSCPFIPAVNQVEAHIFFPQLSLQRQLSAEGTHMQAWSPFAAGRQQIFKNPILTGIGHKYGKSATQVALRFLLQNGISAIPKSSRSQRMAENLDIFDFKLSKDDMASLAGLDTGRSLFGWY